jgi:hypothetical protein
LICDCDCLAQKGCFLGGSKIRTQLVSIAVSRETSGGS